MRHSQEQLSHMTAEQLFELYTALSAELEAVSKALHDLYTSADDAPIEPDSNLTVDID